MRSVNTKAMDAVTASANSAAILAENLFNMSVFAVAGSTIAGTLKVQASNDYFESGANFVPANWVDIASQTVSITGTAGNFLIPKFDLCYTWVRLVFTKSGGAGTLTVIVKALGA